MFAVDPDLLTIFAYVVPVPAELKHTVPGVISCTWLPVVITSDKTPEPVSYTHLTLPTICSV